MIPVCVSKRAWSLVRAVEIEYSMRRIHIRCRIAPDAGRTGVNWLGGYRVEQL